MAFSQTLNALHKFFLLALISSSASGQDNFSSKPLDCPHCGNWLISSSSINSFIGDFVLADEGQFVIQGCGAFVYNNAAIKSKAVSENKFEYNFKTSFVGHNSSLGVSSLCGGKDKSWSPTELILTMNIYAHFLDGGYADFYLSRNGIAQPILAFRAWNINREDPCGSGSGFGTGDCISIGNAELRKTLWSMVDSSEDLLLAINSSKQPKRFNLTRFMNKAIIYCNNREKDSGGGHWPATWALNCIGEQMTAKINEFHHWKTCIKLKPNALSCQFPNDSSLSKKLATD